MPQENQDVPVLPDLDPSQLFPGCRFRLDDVWWTLKSAATPRPGYNHLYRILAYKNSGDTSAREFDITTQGSNYHVASRSFRGLALHCGFNTRDDKVSAWDVPANRPMFANGCYSVGSGGFVLIQGNLAFLGKAGIVTRLEFDNRFGEGMPSALSGTFAACADVTRLRPADLEPGVVFALLYNEEFHSLHRRRDHGIEPLDGYARMTLKGLENEPAFRIVRLTRDQTGLRAAPGALVKWDGKVCKILKVLPNGNVIAANKEGYAEACRVEKAKNELYGDRVAIGGLWHTCTSSISAEDFAVPTVPEFDGTWRYGTSLLPLGTSPETSTRFLVLSLSVNDYTESGQVQEITLRVRSVDREGGYLDESFYTYWKIDGVVYGKRMFTKRADPAPAPEAREGDLFRGLLGDHYIFCSPNVWRELRLADGEDSWISPCGPPVIGAYENGFYRARNNDNEAVPYSLLARAGEWCLTDVEGELTVLLEENQVADWNNEGQILPFLDDPAVWNGTKPITFHRLVSQVCAVCSAEGARQAMLRVAHSVAGMVYVCPRHRSESSSLFVCDGCTSHRMVSDRHANGNCNACVNVGRVPNAIRSYSYRPTPDFHGNGPLFMGVELELECSSRGNKSRAQLASEISTTLPDLFYSKSDGSIRNGLEIVSHPFSVDYMLENKERFTTLFSIISPHMEAATNVGIHIHTSKLGYAVDPASIPHLKSELSRDRLISRGLLRAQKFVYGNPQLVKHFAGRDSKQYACLDIKPGRANEDGYQDRATTTGEVLRLSRELDSHKASRYSAMNFTEKTVEYRVFRSTTSLDEYMRNVLFIESVVEYSRHHAMPKSGSPSLKAYRAFLEGKERWKPVAAYFDVWATGKNMVQSPVLPVAVLPARRVQPRYVAEPGF